MALPDPNTSSGDSTDTASAVAGSAEAGGQVAGAGLDAASAASNATPESLAAAELPLPSVGDAPDAGQAVASATPQAPVDPSSELALPDVDGAAGDQSELEAAGQTASDSQQSVSDAADTVKKSGADDGSDLS